MKVVALVSGGKDSCYAMMRCIHFGHEIVALANLLPEQDNVDELDSYMYQTVGHQIVESYAKCMGLPLFRKRIRGSSKSIELRYTETDGDEVEDLEVLLREVKEQIPSVTAVSSGAIASNYQRLRVENVCSRLGLVSLAYLWMQDQAELLQQMLDNRISAVLVKVAAMGLQPQKHLGNDLSVMYPVLTQLHEQYGCNICGEGGEYESLTLDCPLFKNACIVLDEFDIVLASEDSISQVGFLHPNQFHLESKTRDADEGNGAVHWVDDSVEIIKRPVKMITQVPDGEGAGECQSAVTEQYVTISCWWTSEGGAGQDLSLVFSLVHKHLVKEGLDWADVLYNHLYIQHMRDFAEVNNAYSRHITEMGCPSGVPSRSTVAVPLTSHGLGEVMVEVLASRNKPKRVLHVQSISCWAPSCIGPYSQATLHEGILFMAGQIGLDPATMALLTGAEANQCIRNARAVAESFGTSLSRSSISIVVYCSPGFGAETFLESWDSFVRESGRSSFSPPLPLLLFVHVSDLPKGASVEIEPLIICSSGDDNDIPFEAGVRNSYCIDSVSGVYITPDCFSIPGVLCRAFVSVRYVSSSTADMMTLLMAELKTILKDADLQWSDVSALRIYHRQKDIAALRESIKAHFPALVMVPVHATGQFCSDDLALDILARRAPCKALL